MVELWKGSLKHKSTKPQNRVITGLTRDPVFWKQPSDYETKHPKLYTVSSRPASRDPVFYTNSLSSSCFMLFVI